ncbi:guanine nucleotide exchange factor in Golgi transport N-terminal-domain-containing protein [Lactarius pseudohatsudake]|nr:guanine nucleotide exchange factor in Golgi transport N-terminal-domain-containing protein [Lactarius pseudohatsudake]
MSSLSLLVTELQSLASETRRKHPEVREAAEKSLALLRSSPEQLTTNLASDGRHADDFLRPVFMGCATKNAKVITISLGSLQRLIALRAISLSSLPAVIQTINDCMTQGVDIQLKILQTLLSLITNFPAIQGRLLADALLLCFKLHESRTAVVSSTAAATLRQLVMFVVDKVVEEDRRLLHANELEPITLPDGTTQTLGLAARDAFAIFEDLCLLGNGERPQFLQLEYLHKTFALELIESVLTNYHDLFRKHSELLLLLRHHLSPLLLKTLSERSTFPLTLRGTRVVFLLLKQFSSNLSTEAEVFLMLLIKIVAGEVEAAEARPGWMKVLAMEIMRALCSDVEFMRGVWQSYDASAGDSDSGGSGNARVFTYLISALKRLVTSRRVPPCLASPRRCRALVFRRTIRSRIAVIVWTALRGWSQLLPVRQCLMLSG